MGNERMLIFDGKVFETSEHYVNDQPARCDCLAFRIAIAIVKEKPVCAACLHDRMMTGSWEVVR